MYNRIREIVAEQAAGISPESIENDTVLEELGLDCLDAVEISIAIEFEFDIEFGDSEMDQMVTKGLTFGDLIRIVKGKVEDAD